MSRSIPYDSYKRLLDIAASSAGLVITAPVMALVALLVRQNLGSPVIFRQARPGKDGKVFTLYKFRSMRAVDQFQGLITNEDRITDFGRLLRSTSLDELPSLLNVLKGQMSLVGPRPLLVEYLPRYSAEQARRHEVVPGITGLAQVRGRNSLTWEEKFQSDVEYVDTRSFCVDVRILAKTVLRVFERSGIESDGHVVGAPFDEDELSG